MVMSLLGIGTHRIASRGVSSSSSLMAHYAREVGTIASSDEGPESSPDVAKNYRPHFTEFLTKPENQEDSCSVAWQIVKLMNGEMERLSPAPRTREADS
jgi:hypothetical protein